MFKCQRTRGFTLIEMSIVLMIIAAVVAAVLSGRAILATSQLQSVISETSKLTTAIGQFKESFQGMPGDITGAAAQWGTDSSGCPTGGGTSGTCDGNADGRIGSNCGSGTWSSTYAYESFRAWQHLSNSGLYSTSLTGVTASGTFVTSLNSNIPSSSLSGAGYVLLWLDDPSVCSNNQQLLTSSGAYGNVITLVGKLAMNGGGTAYTVTSALTTDQISGIDGKVDDGVPGTGNVRSFGAGTTGCATTTAATTAAYSLTTSGRICAPIFLTGY